MHRGGLVEVAQLHFDPVGLARAAEEVLRRGESHENHVAIDELDARIENRRDPEVRAVRAELRVAARNYRCHDSHSVARLYLELVGQRPAEQQAWNLSAL